jgi:hypothetical protein
MAKVNLSDLFWKVVTVIYRGHAIDRADVSREINAGDAEQWEPYVPTTVRRPALYSHKVLARAFEQEFSVDQPQQQLDDPTRQALRRAADRAAASMTTTGLVSPEVAGLVAIDMVEAIFLEMGTAQQGQGATALAASFAVRLVQGMAERYNAQGVDVQ